MAKFELVKSITLPVVDPGGGNTLPQYAAVIFQLAGINEPVAITDQPVGIVLESVTKAEFDAGKVVAPVAPLIPGSIVPMVANATLAVGANVSLAINTGRAQASVGTQQIIGQVYEGGAAGDIISVLVGAGRLA